MQRILRHANVSTTAAYYIKTAATDVHSAMAKQEQVIPSTLKPTASEVTENGSGPSQQVQDSLLTQTPER